MGGGRRDLGLWACGLCQHPKVPFDFSRPKAWLRPLSSSRLVFACLEPQRDRRGYQREHKLVTCHHLGCRGWT